MSQTILARYKLESVVHQQSEGQSQVPAAQQGMQESSEEHVARKLWCAVRNILFVIAVCGLPVVTAVVIRFIAFYPHANEILQTIARMILPTAWPF
jgi:hypothetical protein